MVPKLYIARTSDGEGLPLPSYVSRNHIALNLQAAISAPIRIKAGERAYVPVGFAIGIPNGFCGQVVSLPSLARQEGLVVSDAPQVIHPAERGPLFILLQNMGGSDVVLHRGLICAQLLVLPAIQISWNEVKPSVGQDKATPSEMILLDQGEHVEEDGAAPLEPSPRREVHSIRNRYKKEGDDE